MASLFDRHNRICSAIADAGGCNALQRTNALRTFQTPRIVADVAQVRIARWQRLGAESQATSNNFPVRLSPKTLSSNQFLVLAWSPTRKTILYFPRLDNWTAAETNYRFFSCWGLLCHRRQNRCARNTDWPRHGGRVHVLRCASKSTLRESCSPVMCFNDRGRGVPPHHHRSPPRLRTNAPNAEVKF